MSIFALLLRYYVIEGTNQLVNVNAVSQRALLDIFKMSCSTAEAAHA